MAKVKPLPLTAAEIRRVQIFARWLGSRLPDPVGKRPKYTNKELGDFADLFLHETKGWNLEPAELVHLTRRYWAKKGATTKATNKRKAERAAKAARRDAAKRRQQELAERQRAFSFL